MTVAALPQEHPVRFAEPLPGFPSERDFTLDPVDPGQMLFSLRSCTNPSLRFVLAPAEKFFTGYHPIIPAHALSALGNAKADVYVMVTVGRGLEDATANLRAPIVVCDDAAVQVVLDDDTLPMRQPLLQVT